MKGGKLNISLSVFPWVFSNKAYEGPAFGAPQQSHLLSHVYTTIAEIPNNLFKNGGFGIDLVHRTIFEYLL